MNLEFEKDYFRLTGEKLDNSLTKWKLIKHLVINHGLCYIFFLRQAQNSNNNIKKNCSKAVLIHLQRKYGLEISHETDIGEGFYLGHAFNITINPATILGNNINIHKGVTIGQENRGNRKGVPTIGDFVWIGVNSTLTGSIKIGNNVLIAPNSYVNFDVPDNSLVIGNPARIIPKENATEGYLNRTV